VSAALRRGSLSFGALKRLSFAHSAVYFGLLAVAVGHGPAELKTVLGWAHGLGWIAMCVLILAALRARVVSLRLAVAVTVIGGVGPFIGSIEFVREQRRARARGEV
jgi:hypothetical protein